MSEEEIVEEPTEATNEEIVDEESPCPTCDLEKALSAMTLTSSCYAVKDGESRKECFSWAESLDPDQISDFSEVAREAVRRVGVSGMNTFAKDLNQMMHGAILDVLNEKKAAGEPLDGVEQAAYKFLTMERGV
ncbi:MAG: hypothetical protein WCQ69_07960 [Bacteroidales bacterium]|jgi:hypothetical protein